MGNFLNRPYFFYPSTEFAKYISRYWYCQHIYFMPVLPPGSGCELFMFSKKVMVFDESEPYKAEYVDSVLVRPRHAPIRFVCDEPISFISIRFRLGSINYFTHYLESDYQTLMSPYDLWGQSFYRLRESILNTNIMSEKTRMIEDFLRHAMTSFFTAKVDLAKFFLDEMYYNPNHLSLSDIVHHSGYSDRHLQKTVKLVTGLTLIQAKKLIRFEHAVKKLFFGGMCDTSKTYLDDYYDQSHFIKDFNGFTGMSPKSFLADHQDSAMFYKKMALNHEK